MSSRIELSASFDSSSSHEWSQKEEIDYVVGVYRYPRAVIRLPVAMMRPTDKFKNELAAALSETSNTDIKKKRLIDFFTEYGQAFASEVYLGGHVHMSMSMQKSGNVSISISIVFFVSFYGTSFRLPLTQLKRPCELDSERLLVWGLTWELAQAGLKKLQQPLGN